MSAKGRLIKGENQLARHGIIEKGELRIGHPAGIIISKGTADKENGTFVLKKATVDRTARCLMKIGERTRQCT
jgi:2-methylaconitate cis-trans-isomerase PrpF